MEQSGAPDVESRESGEESQEEGRDRGRRTQAERTALSDARMFNAAIELINERGTQKTTLKDIGERAGYSRGLAHSRFGSKEGFMDQLFTRFDGRWKGHLDGYVRGKTGLEAVKAAARSLRDFLAEESGYMRAMYVLWYESLGHESAMREKLAAHHRVYREDATRWIQDGIDSGEVDPRIDAEQFALQYCAFVFGVVYQWLVNADAVDLDALFAHYEMTIERALAKKEE